MTSSVPFIREVELLIGPLEESQGGGPTNEALRIFSNGDRQSVRVTFAVQKSILGTPNNSTIDIYNLKKETRDRINKTLTKVQLRVGYQNTALSLLTQGALLSAPTIKRGPDLITTITMLDGFGGMVRGITNRNFGPFQSVARVVRSIAGDMPGVSIGTIDVDGSLGAGGLVISDRSAEALDMLAEQYGFSWSIQNGTLQALSDRRAFAEAFLLSSQRRNLISVKPQLTGPMQVVTGAFIQAILNPSLKPGAQVEVESNVETNLNGLYKAHNVSYQGDTHGDDWLMDIESFKFL